MLSNSSSPLLADFLPPHFLFSSFAAPADQLPPPPPFPSFPFPSLSYPSKPAAAAEERVFLVLVPQPPPSSAAAVPVPLSALVSSAENALEEIGEGIQEEEKTKQPDALSLAPQTWRKYNYGLICIKWLKIPGVVLGDLCQLPNLRRPTERADTFAECMALDSREEEIGTRIGRSSNSIIVKIVKNS
jgi:hypothetical protein